MAPRAVMPDERVDLDAATPPAGELLGGRLRVQEALRGLDAVHDPQPGESRALARRQRLPGGVGARELRIATLVGQRARAEQRAARRHVVGGAVDVPEERALQV